MNIQKAEINGKEHIFKFTDLTGPDCNVYFKESQNKDGTTLYIINGRPVYDVYSGTYQVSYMDGHNEWFSTYVDALTGEPLFVQNRVMF